MSNIRVWLLANYAADGQESMQRYARLVQELFDGDPEIELQLHIPPVIIGATFGNSFWKKWAGYWDKYVVFPRRIRQLWKQLPEAKRPDWIHVADHSNAPWLRHFQGMPVVITCHDIFAIESALGNIPKNPTRWSGKLLQKWISHHLGRTKYLISVSEYTAKQLKKRFPDAGSGALEVIHSALNTNYLEGLSAEARRAKEGHASPWLEPTRRSALQRDLEGPAPSGLQSDDDLLDVPLLFNVSNNSWYKNRLGLVGIFGQVCELSKAEGHKVPLLVFGGKWPTPDLEQLVNNSPWCERIRFTGPLTNDDLAAFYRRASLFVFPSFVEGFGWPPLEAQSSGCPVISGNGGALAETLQDSAVLCDPRDKDNFAQQIVRLLNDKAFLDSLVLKGHENVQRFTREKMADNYRAFYQRHRHGNKEESF